MLVNGETEWLKKELMLAIGAKERLKAEVDVNFILAVGIVARTADEMILDGSAVKGLRKALSLVGWGNLEPTKYHLDALNDLIEEWMRPRLEAFESRYPDFPIVQFIDDVFELERVFDGDGAFRDYKVGLSAKVKGDDILIGGNFGVMNDEDDE
jgi:hypothetical protein